MSAGEATPLEQGRLRAIFDRGRCLSIKLDSYFQVYERVLERFVDRRVTFVEVGVLHGGSLFMWREYLGPQARIIGVDLNPQAARWREHGFEIHIGNQADPAFWAAFFADVGRIDVLLDDGGHTNRQQIVTTLAALDHIDDGGLLIVEDVHASFMREFDNPSRGSFVNYAAFVAGSLTRRFEPLPAPRSEVWRQVFSVEFYDSIVVMNVDRPRCVRSRVVGNGGESNQARDYRHQGIADIVTRVDRALAFANRIIVLKSIKKRLLRALVFVANRINDARLQKHFR